MELLLPTNIMKLRITEKEFTFQYGATSTNIEPVKANIIVKFTFQYGATSTHYNNIIRYQF
jgi:hypothetical protein